MDELDTHQPIPILPDLQILKQYRDGLAVVKFLSGFRPYVASQICSHVLGVDMISSLSFTFARALRVSTGVPTSVPE